MNGYPDLYITNYGPDQLYLNDKGNRFVNVTADAGISNDRWSVSAAFADINRDGWLDLYVANYVDYDASHECPTADGLPDYCNPLQFPGTTDLMLVNTGTTIERDGLRIPTFRDMSLESGIASAKGAGLGVALIDAN
jgi:enediyne biosynthesis protein E4